MLHLFVKDFTALRKSRSKRIYNICYVTFRKCSVDKMKGWQSPQKVPEVLLSIQGVEKLLLLLMMFLNAFFYIFDLHTFF